MNEKEALALASMIDEMFIKEEILGMLISTLMHIYKGDKEKIIGYLAQMKSVESNLH